MKRASLPLHHSGPQVRRLLHCMSQQLARSVSAASCRLRLVSKVSIDEWRDAARHGQRYGRMNLSAALGSPGGRWVECAACPPRPSLQASCARSIANPALLWRAQPCARQRLKAKVISVELDQVEGPHEDALIIPSVADAIERREPVLTTCHGLAVNDAGLQAQPNRRLDDKRKAPGQVIARPAVQFHPLAGLASDNPEAIVLRFRLRPIASFTEPLRKSVAAVPVAIGVSPSTWS
jgi:hypothetical protein